MRFKIFISKIRFKIAPSKNAFQNCYLNSIVIEGIRTLFSLQKIKKKHTQIKLLNKT